MEESERNRYHNYVDKLNQVESIELKRKREETSRWRKFRQSKVLLKQDWQVFKSSAYVGGLSGAALGFVLSIPVFIKYRQVSVIIVSMVATGGFFATISGVGSLMRHEDLDLADERMKVEGFVTNDF